MGKLAFVTPWYGENIPGGAEAELRGLVTHLAEAGVELEILTTCVEKFQSDWNKNFYKPGVYDVKNITVRRFKVRKRDSDKFDAVNYKLIKGKNVTPEEERIYIEEMVNSPELYSYISENQNDYDLFIYIPYMFGTTFNGILACPEKAVMIPCFHDESYIYMDIYKMAFEKVRGMIFHAYPEKELANRVFDLKNVKVKVLGEGVDSDFNYDAQAFRVKFGITDPFVLYAGRKEAGKKVDTLVNYFAIYKKRNPDNNVKLILIGGGKIEIPDDVKEEIIDLGFVEREDKYNACAAATVLCQPSLNESFSLVVMESWLCERPVLVNEKCAVTKDFVSRVNGGLYFNDYYEFEACLDYFIMNQDVSAIMGKNGRKFVLENYLWDVIIKNYCEFFNEIIANKY